MRIITGLVVFIACLGASYAGDLNVRVVLSGQVVPGVYGQVNFGNETPPPVVYARPMVVEPQYDPPPPVYLHVPPGHAKNWRKHCHEYNACNTPVYFVRSQEYDPEYQRHYRDHERERELERRRWDEREREEGRERGGRNGHWHADEGHDKHEDH